MSIKKRIAISIATFLILGVSIGFALWQQSSSETSQEGSDEKHLEDESIGRIDENQVIEKGNSETENSEADDTHTDPRKVIDPTITSVDQSNSQVIIRAIVSGATSGTCTAVLSKSGHNPIRINAPIEVQSSYYICQGFNINKSELPEKGTWNIKVEFESDTAKGASRSESINVR